MRNDDAIIKELDAAIYKDWDNHEFLAYYENLTKQKLSKKVQRSVQFEVIMQLRECVLIELKDAGEDIEPYLEDYEK